MNFTIDSIRVHVDWGSFERGRQYFTNGKVKDVVIEDDIVFGKVAGSRSSPYDAKFTVYNGEIIDSECTCPVGYGCKHVAALGLKALLLAANAPQKYAPVPPYVQSKTVQQRQRKWMEPLSQFIEKEKTEKYIFHLQILIQLEQKHESIYWEARSRFPSAQNKEWEFVFRPRLLDPQTKKFSASKLTWAKGYSGNYPIYWEKEGVLDDSHFVYLQLLANGLESRYASSWEAIDNAKSSYVWQILKQHKDYGVELLGGQKGQLSTTLVDTPIELQLAIDETQNGISIKKKIVHLGKDISDKNSAIVGNPPAFAVIEDGGYFLHPVVANAQAINNFTQEVHVPKEDIPVLQKQFLPELVKRFAINSSVKTVVLPQTVFLQPTLTIERIKDMRMRVVFGFVYKNKTFPFSDTPEEFSLSEKETVLVDQKHLQETKQVLKEFFVNDFTEFIFLEGVAAARFMVETIPLLQEKIVDLKVIAAQDLPEYSHDTTEAEVTFSIDENEESYDWFDLQITVRIGDEKVPFHSLFTAMVGGEEYLLLESGRYFPINTPQFDKLKQLVAEAKSIQEKGTDGIKLSRFQAGLWDELQKTGIIAKQAKRWEEAMQGLLAVKSVEQQSVPKQLQAILRPYQIEGYSWLHFLRQHKLGGVLADDMGLGKTIQTIAMIQNSKSEAPFLVVAPTSVVENWDLELKKFAPKLKRVILRAGNRSKQFPKITKSDIVVVSYALLVRDFEKLKGIVFDSIIVDEAQMVKNHQAKAYSCVRKLRASCKIALTGTPMENNLMELWSILSLVAPGLFPSPKHFQEQYRTPIEKRQDKQQLGKLRQRIRPFMLRRKKEIVETQLPSKNEQVSFLTLTDEHRHIYDLHLQYERKRVLGLLQSGGLKENRFEILRSLMRLRQLCLHPGLVDEKHKTMVPTKLIALEEQLEEIVAEGHRVLIFSQFTSFLNLARSMIERIGYKYLYLAGETKNRGVLIDTFQKDTEIPIFLISLKAGGFGITLTAADYCILLDPWWNPAAEQQAVDRTHRIGQTKPVFVYKFIAKDTIEEKVLKLQEKKRELFKNVMDEGEMFGSMITEDDIKSIFA